MSRRILYGAHDPEWNEKELCRWAATTIGIGGGFSSDARAMAIEIDGDIAAVTVWNCFELYNCLMSIASDGKKRWMTREFLFRSFAYPFLQIGLPRVTAKFDEANEDSLRLGYHLGFKQEGVLRRAGPGGRDEIMIGMLREECRWITPEMAKHSVKEKING